MAADAAAYDAEMPGELYTSVKPAVGHRGKLAGGAMLVLACLLAGSLVASRSRNPVRPRIHVPGWGISFQPPGGFVVGDLVHRDFGVAIPFFGRDSQGRPLTCAVWRLTVPHHEGAEERLAFELVRGYLRSEVDGPEAAVAGPARLGPLEAVELRAPPQAPQAIARVGFGRDGPAYGICLGSEVEPLGPEALDWFDQACDSIRPIP